jgi:3-hydroxyacyl-CoA dehydrogenase/3-hydroxy-2-methylbutyryl-CoA dehydrogenase
MTYGFVFVKIFNTFCLYEHVGKATVERFVRQGGKVVICDLPTSNGQQLADTLGANAIFCPANITSEEEIKNALKITKEKFGRLDALVNCAGIGVAFRTYTPSKRRCHTLEDFQKVINVNLVGTFNAIRLACDLFNDNEPNQDKQRGVIVNTASVAAFDGQIGQAAYSASKPYDQ